MYSTPVIAPALGETKKPIRSAASYGRLGLPNRTPPIESIISCRTLSSSVPLASAIRLTKASASSVSAHPGATRTTLCPLGLSALNPAAVNGQSGLSRRIRHAGVKQWELLSIEVTWTITADFCSSINGMRPRSILTAGQKFRSDADVQISSCFAANHHLARCRSPAGNPQVE